MQGISFLGSTVPDLQQFSSHLVCSEEMARDQALAITMIGIIVEYNAETAFKRPRPVPFSICCAESYSFPSCSLLVAVFGAWRSLLPESEQDVEDCRLIVATCMFLVIGLSGIYLRVRTQRMSLRIWRR